MKGGAIALPTEGGRLTDEAFPYTRKEADEKLLSTLDLDGRVQDLEGFEITTGTVVHEFLNEHTDHDIRADGAVSTSERTQVEAQTTEVVYVQDEFLITESTGQEFAHDAIEAGLGEDTVVPGHIDLVSFAESHPDAKPWMGGFYGRDAPVDAGTAFGEYDEDDELHDVVAEAELNQLGLKHVEFNGRLLKIRLTESGYVEVYDPSDVGTVEFSRFIRDRVLPHTIRVTEN